MKVLLYSHSFHPALGGIETVSLTLASGFVSSGLECKVVTKSESGSPDFFPFAVYRNPKIRKQLSLIKWADIILFNGISLALQPWVIIYNKPLIWVHAGYQVSCIDGCGWVKGKKAPLSPLESIIYHVRFSGWKEGSKGALKLIAKRLVARYLVSANVAITKWMFDQQKLPRQVQIYNPFPLESFIQDPDADPEFDFLYLGRIVSEKGVSTLILAFSEVVKKQKNPSKLLIIGDGEWKEKIVKLSIESGVSPYITFAGKKSGKELIDFLSKGKIAIVPSEWFEPMGGVALELMAAGKNLIVSEFGGLNECVGDAGLTFKNGDHKGLALCMTKLLNDRSLQARQLKYFKERIKLFLPSKFVTQYILLMQEVVDRH